MSSGDGDKRQTPGNYNCQRDSDKTTKLYVFCIAVAHSEVHARCPRCCEEADDDCYYRQKADERLGIIGDLEVASAANIGKENDEDHYKWYDRQISRYLPDVLNAFKGHKHSQCRPDDRHDGESDTSGEHTCSRVLRRRLSHCLKDEIGSDGGVHSEPAELKQAHQQARHQKAPLCAIGR